MHYFYSPSTRGFYLESLHAAGGLPLDGVKVTEEERQALLDGQAQGLTIEINDQGRPVAKRSAREPIQERRERARRAIDAAAGDARAAFVSAGQLVEEEYRLALRQVQQWRDAGQPADAVPEAIQHWADAAKLSALDAADDIERTAARWQAALLRIRGIRLQGKAAINQAAPDADLMALAQPVIEQLAALPAFEELAGS
ncbi:conserved hypothetical protein [Hahella chejuensis KCTC 2396]|uniref:Uncharacterized protein n=1 Tax=Hahella chejuensis (strain KCTC 2396) TaxID=349521 RepID=Q2S7G7_HAHCH|nr:hypothetical protein [Hahella chejuensis]ABC33407.1 conserved hypothetical protein [Hahella chejuensis KCTC 2396]